jgi:hypothetical protein
MLRILGKRDNSERGPKLRVTVCLFVLLLSSVQSRAQSRRLPPAPGYDTKQSHNPNDVSVEAANGAVIKVDMNSIQRGDGGSLIWTYADEGNETDPYNLQGYFFDCRGHYSLMGLHSSDPIYAPPRSVAARISELACSVPVGTVPR